MKYKIKTKNSFFALYKDTIVIMGFLLFLIVGPCIFLSYPEEIGMILMGLFSLFIPYMIYTYITFLSRQRNLPLTKEELEMLNIKSVEDYRKFLDKYLKGWGITNEKIAIICSKSIFFYLLNDEDRLNLLAEATGYEYKINDIVYKELMEREKEMIYPIKDHKIDEIDFMIYEGIENL